MILAAMMSNFKIASFATTSMVVAQAWLFPIISSYANYVVPSHLFIHAPTSVSRHSGQVYFVDNVHEPGSSSLLLEQTLMVAFYKSCHTGQANASPFSPVSKHLRYTLSSHSNIV